MCDAEIGSKRLASMPDRTTNTVRTDAGLAYRPTVINCYAGAPLDSVAMWWEAWRQFMFHDVMVVKGKEKTGHQLLVPIKRAKYPAVTEAEEAISVPLQALCCAIFDAVLIHMMNALAPTTWQALRAQMGQALNAGKTDRILAILRDSYMDRNVIFLQEVAAQFADLARDPANGLVERFAVVAPGKLGRRDQNSVVFVDRARFDADTVEEVSGVVESKMAEGAPVETGDVLAITVTERSSGARFMLASFHGDTNGLATIAVVDAVRAAHADLQEGCGAELKLVFGLDANSHERAKPGKNLGVAQFLEYLDGDGLLGHCWGDRCREPSQCRTTYNARTYLQPQLNKAARLDELLTKGDVNMKDWVLFYRSQVAALDVARDNTGAPDRNYVETVFPTLAFPSDHVVLRASLRLL